MKVELYVDLNTRNFYLTVGDKNYESSQQEKIPDLLRDNVVTKIKVLGYAANPELFMSIINTIPLTGSVQIVDISTNKLESQGPAVAQILAKSTSIHTIDMSSNSLKEFGSAVAQALTKSVSIRTFNVANNWLEEDIPGVAKAFTKSKLTTLDMSGNGLQELARKYDANDLLQEINDSENNIFGDGQDSMPIDLLGSIADLGN